MEDIRGPKPVRRKARLVFTTDKGGPLRRTSFSAQIWVPARKTAKLPADFTYHSLRHFYASALIRFRESVKVVQARLGHKTAEETLNTYGHLWPDSEERTRQAVEAALPAGVLQMCPTEAVQ